MQFTKESVQLNIVGVVKIVHAAICSSGKCSKNGLPDSGTRVVHIVLQVLAAVRCSVIFKSACVITALILFIIMCS